MQKYGQSMQKYATICKNMDLQAYIHKNLQICKIWWSCILNTRLHCCCEVFLACNQLGLLLLQSLACFLCEVFCCCLLSLQTMAFSAIFCKYSMTQLICQIFTSGSTRQIMTLRSLADFCYCLIFVIVWSTFSLFSISYQKNSPNWLQCPSCASWAARY